MSRTLRRQAGLLLIVLGFIVFIMLLLFSSQVILLAEQYLSPDGNISPDGQRQIITMLYLGAFTSLSVGIVLWAFAHPRYGARLDEVFFQDPLYRYQPGQIRPATGLAASTVTGLLIVLSLYFQDPDSALFAALYLEDGLFEMLTAAAFLLAALLMLAAARKAWKWYPGQISRKRLALVYLTIALAVFFVGMEEISWGQRIIGWETPEPFVQGNVQKETNLHNFFNNAFPSIYPLVSLILVPILLAAWLRHIRRWPLFAHLVLPHPSLVGLAWIIAIVAIVWGHQEMIEELLALFALFYTWRLAWVCQKSKRSLHRSPRASVSCCATPAANPARWGFWLLQYTPVV